MQCLPGLMATIGQDCIACGNCHKTCPVNAIFYQDGISAIDKDHCKGCGVFAVVCPEGTPRLHMDESIDVVAKLVDRIRTRAEIGG